MPAMLDSEFASERARGACAGWSPTSSTGRTWIIRAAPKPIPAAPTKVVTTVPRVITSAPAPTRASTIISSRRRPTTSTRRCPTRPVSTNPIAKKAEYRLVCTVVRLSCSFSGSSTLPKPFTAKPSAAQIR